MCRRTSVRTGLLGITLAAALAVSPASALAGTIANGNYTAAPGERNSLEIIYEPGTDSYTYAEGSFTGAGITDGDGLGGCTVTSSQQATCPAALVRHINVSLLDGDDDVTLTGGPIHCHPSGPGPLVRPLVTVPATIEGGEGDDDICGGAANDVLSGGPGDDGISGYEGDDTLLGGEGHDALEWPPTGAPTDIGNTDPSASQGADRLDGGLGADIIFGYEDARFAQATDVINCGSGGEEGGPTPGAAAPPPADGAFNGPSDEVNIDCENIMALAIGCPPNQMCKGELVVQASATGGTSAVASAKKRKKKKKEKRKVIVGRQPFAIFAAPGALGAPVPVNLNANGLSRVLSGRQKAPADVVTQLNKKRGKKSQVALAAGKRKKKKKKFRVVGRTPFVFIKG